jgi:hypothetical protein
MIQPLQYAKKFPEKKKNRPYPVPLALAATTG